MGAKCVIGDSEQPVTPLVRFHLPFTKLSLVLNFASSGEFCSGANQCLHLTLICLQRPHPPAMHADNLIEGKLNMSPWLERLKLLEDATYT